MVPVRTKENFLVFGAPLIEEESINEVANCLRSGWIGAGPKSAEFEAMFASYKGVPKAAAVNSCTSALQLSLKVAGLQPGDEVLTTPMTFCATINTIIHAGAKPVLVDVDPLTMNIDAAKLEQHVTPRTRAILPVHFAGRSCDMDPIMKIAGQYDLKVIEDCAHAIETEYKGRKAGTFGDFSCFSFYSTKNIATGEGGMIISKDEKNMARLKTLSLQGMSRDAWKRFGNEGFKHYQVEECGFKNNFMDLLATMGIYQLKKIDAYWERREQVWQRYMSAFADLPIGLPAPVEDDTRHAYHLFTIMIDEERTGVSRDEFLNRMTNNGIGVGVHYMSVPEHPYYQQNLGWSPRDYPNARRIGRQTVSLPISAKLTDKDINDVIEAVSISIKP